MLRRNMQSSQLPVTQAHYGPISGAPFLATWTQHISSKSSSALVMECAEDDKDNLLDGVDALATVAGAVSIVDSLERLHPRPDVTTARKTIFSRPMHPRHCTDLFRLYLALASSSLRDPSPITAATFDIAVLRLSRSQYSNPDRYVIPGILVSLGLDGPEDASAYPLAQQLLIEELELQTSGFFNLDNLPTSGLIIGVLRFGSRTAVWVLDWAEREVVLYDQRRWKSEDVQLVSWFSDPSDHRISPTLYLP